MRDNEHLRNCAIDDAASLKEWFADRDAKIMGQAVSWPACWGGQFRVSDFGDYVTEDAMHEALPSDHDLSLYYCCCDCSDDKDWAEVARHADDDAWLDRKSEDYVASDSAVVFYTESFPGDDFDHSELVELAQERPDLFAKDNLEDWPDLVKPALEAGIDCTLNGEPTWYSSEESFKGLHTLSELRTYFANEPQLEQDRRAGSTCETWIADLERLALLERVPDGGAVRSRDPQRVADGASKVAADFGDARTERSSNLHQ